MLLVSSPDPTLSRGETVWWTMDNTLFMWIRNTVYCTLKITDAILVKRCHDGLQNNNPFIKYSQCIVWVHLLKFLGHQSNVNLPNHSPYTFGLHFLHQERALQHVWYRTTKITLQIVLLAYWYFFETLMNNNEYTLCCKPHVHPSLYSRQRRLWRMKHPLYEPYCLWFCIKQFADSF